MIRLTLFVAMGITTVASAQQWQARTLDPINFEGSAAMAGHSGSQTGYFFDGPERRAAVWRGTAASMVDLHPPTSNESVAQTVYGNRQGGWIGAPGGIHAAIWEGTAASMLDLHPPLVGTRSEVLGMDDSVQVGRIGSAPWRAAMWSGTAASVIDLHPTHAGVGTSLAHDVAGSEQVGVVDFGPSHAALWRGTAISYVNLNPANARNSSANAVANGEQFGSADFAGGPNAAMWSGTAASYVDMHPTSTEWSDILDAEERGYQCGWAQINGDRRASVWKGTASSWIDLHAVLPSNYTSSIATGIWTTDTHVFVTGHAFNATRGVEEAMLWERRCPADCDTSTGPGVLDIFDFLCFQNDFVNGRPSACNCDETTGPGRCDIFDFLCFQDFFVAGCP